MLARSLTIALRLWSGAVRMSEANTGRRFPALNIFTGAMTMLFFALLPVCLILSWATERGLRGLLGFSVTALLILVWLLVIAIAWAYGGGGEGS